MIATLLALIVAHAFLVMGLALPLRVAGDSMAPALLPGDRIYVDRSSFWFRGPQRWEVIGFPNPDRPLDMCVKRIAGLPGERVQIKGGKVYTDDQPRTPPFAATYGPRSGQELGLSVEYILGPDEYFVLGDNSLVSVDSRTWEPPGIPANSICGRVIFGRTGSGEPPVTGGP